MTLIISFNENKAGLTIYRSKYLPIYLCTFRPIDPPTYLPICLPIYVPIYPCTFIFIYLPTYLPIYLSICLSTHPSISLSLSLANHRWTSLVSYWMFSILPPTPPTDLAADLLTLPTCHLSIYCLFPWFICTGNHRPHSHGWMRVAKGKWYGYLIWINISYGYGPVSARPHFLVDRHLNLMTGYGTLPPWLSAQSLHQPSQCIQLWLHTSCFVNVTVCFFNPISLT